MIRVLLQNIYLKFDFFLFILCDIHNFDGSKLASLSMATLKKNHGQNAVFYD